MPKTKLALGLIVKDEIRFIKPWLEHYTKVFGRGDILILDTGSTDGTQSLADYHIDGRVFNFSLWVNTLLANATGRGYSHLLIVDADECLTVEDLKTIIERVEAYNPQKMVFFPFIHFTRNLEVPLDYIPDLKGRLFPLNGKYECLNKLHNLVYYKNSTTMAFEDAFVMFDISIKHYGDHRNRREQMLKIVNYEKHRTDQPLSKLDDIPEDVGDLHANLKLKKHLGPPLINFPIL